MSDETIEITMDSSGETLPLEDIDDGFKRFWLQTSGTRYLDNRPVYLQVALFHNFILRQWRMEADVFERGLFTGHTWLKPLLERLYNDEPPTEAACWQEAYALFLEQTMEARVP